MNRQLSFLRLLLQNQSNVHIHPLLFHHHLFSQWNVHIHPLLFHHYLHFQLNDHIHPLLIHHYQPFQLNAKGGKELLTGIIFGPLLVSGVYYSACGTFTSNMWIISAIVGFSVLNIAYVHAVVDAETDKAMHRITIPILLKNRTLIAVFALIFAFLPVVITLIGCCTHILSWWYILIGLALPRTIALAYYMLTFGRKENEHISPKKWMGSMQYWSDIQAYHIEWFMIRWYLARNTMSLYLLLIMIASILTWIIQ